MFQLWSFALLKNIYVAREGTQDLLKWESLSPSPLIHPATGIHFERVHFGAY